MPTLTLLVWLLGAVLGVAVLLLLAGSLARAVGFGYHMGRYRAQQVIRARVHRPAKLHTVQPGDTLASIKASDPYVAYAPDAVDRMSGAPW